MSQENENNPRQSSAFWAKIRRYFIAGVLITAPISITLYLSFVIIKLIDRNVDKVLPARYNPETYLPFDIPGIGLVIVFLFLTMVGALTAGFVGRLWLRITESVLNKMPVVRSIYMALKQIFETVFSDSSRSFKDAVLVEYPRTGMWVIGFLTGRTKGEVQDKTKGNMVNVFIPTTPNPTSGFLIFVSEKEVVDLDMSVEDALKMIISAGIVTPEDAAQTKKIVSNPTADK